MCIRDSNRILYLLDQKEAKCVKMLQELRQAQERRRMKFEQAIPRSIIAEVLGAEEPIAQMVATKDITQRASSGEIASAQQHYTHMPYFRLSRPNSPVDNSDEVDYDSEYERQQRCRMAEIRRRRLTRRTR